MKAGEDYINKERLFKKAYSNYLKAKKLIIKKLGVMFCCWE